MQYSPGIYDNLDHTNCLWSKDLMPVVSDISGVFLFSIAQVAFVYRLDCSHSRQLNASISLVCKH